MIEGILGRVLVGDSHPVRLMGIINLSRESFYQGSVAGPHEALSLAAAMQEQGADMIDLGGVSTAPGSPPISEAVERERLFPALKDILDNLDISVSIDTKRSLPYQPWFRRPGVRWECRRVRRYEPDCARGFRENWVVSDVDAQDLEARGCPRVAVLPLGVDERLLSLPLEPRRVPRVAFLGNLSVPHNVDAANWLAREIWPLVRAALPAAELEIVGADPLPQVLALADLPGVSVTGALPSLLPVWERSALLLAPLRFSSGVQYKLLEPMAAGVPVVTTLQAAEAIGARDGVELRTGTDAASLAAAAIDVLGAGERLMPMLGAARELVRRRFSWETLVDRLERLAAGGDSH